MAMGRENHLSLEAYKDLCNNFFKFAKRQETLGQSNKEIDQQCQFENNCPGTAEKITWMHDFMRNSAEEIFKHKKLQETLQSQLDQKTTECKQLENTIAGLNSDLMEKTVLFEQLKTFVEYLNLDLKESYKSLEAEKRRLDRLAGHSEKLCHLLGVVSTPFTEDSSILVNTQSDIEKNNIDTQQSTNLSIRLQPCHTPNFSSQLEERFNVRVNLKNASSLDNSISPQRSEKHDKNSNKGKGGNTKENNTENQHDSESDLGRDEDIEIACLDALAVVYRAKVIVSNFSNTECNYSDVTKLIKDVYLTIINEEFKEKITKPVTLPDYITKFIEVFLPKTIVKILPICDKDCTEEEKYDIAAGACQFATAEVYRAKQKFSIANNLEFNDDDASDFTQELFAILMHELDKTRTTESGIVSEPIPKSSQHFPTSHAEEPLVSTSPTVSPSANSAESPEQKNMEKENSSVSTRKSNRKRLFKRSDGSWLYGKKMWTS